MPFAQFVDLEWIFLDVLCIPFNLPFYRLNIFLSYGEILARYRKAKKAGRNGVYTSLRLFNVTEPSKNRIRGRKAFKFR